MADQVLIRGIPRGVQKWIEKERNERRMGQKEFIIKILRSAAEGNPQSQQKTERDETGAFTFVDLFAGIGGFRIALEKAGGRCVFTSEWDKYAQKTYKEWFGDSPYGDITKIDPGTIPDHDVLAGGFPCQPFSIAGVSKKKSLGREHGFKDKTQGTLFFHLATIAEIKRPPVLLLENVKNLTHHDGGRTYEVIKTTLEELRYVVFDKIIDAANFVPQHRERIFIVCFDREIFGDNPPFEFPPLPKKKPKLKSILDGKVDEKYTLTAHLWNYLKEYAKRHKEKGNGFGYSIADPNGVTRTLSARYYKDGSEILIEQGRNKNPRRLTPKEAAKLMGFDGYENRIVVSDTQAYKQFGNAVCPPVAEAVAKEMVKTIKWQIRNSGTGCLLKSRIGMSCKRREGK